MTGRAAAFVVLLIACLGFGIVIYREVIKSGDGTARDPAVAKMSAPSSADADRQGAAFALPPLQSFAEVTARPLFSQSRRPLPEAGQNGIGPTSSWVLRGVIISQAVRAALVEHGKPSILSRVEQGHDVEGWTVSSIFPDRVVLESGGTQEELKLYNQTSDGPAAPGAPHPDGAAQ